MIDTPVPAIISVVLAGPAVTNPTPTVSVIAPSGPDAGAVASFQFTNITNGELFQSDGTPITNGEFVGITNSGGRAETVGRYTPGLVSYTVQESTTDDATGLSGPVLAASVQASLVGPTVTGTTTIENTQTTSGLVLTPAADDVHGLATNFQITGITGGTLYQKNGTTPIANGSFITVAQGAAGLKFTPAAGSLASGSFSVQESTTGAAGACADGHGHHRRHVVRRGSDEVPRRPKTRRPFSAW